MSALASALLADLTHDDLAQLAERLAPYLPRDDAGWLTTKEAAGHLGMSVHALHKLTATRAIPFEQSTPGAKCWFRRSDLDKWRSAGGR